MDIRQFSPQTQRTLATRDFNQDQKLSARELELFQNMPQVPGIDQKDLAVIQAALRKAKGPDTIIVSLVDDTEALPGVKKTEPIYTIKPEKIAAETKPAVPSQSPEQKTAKGSAKATATQDGFKVTAVPKEAKPAKPGVAVPEEVMDVQTTGQVGALKVKSTSSFTDGQHKGSKINATLAPSADLGLTLGVESAADTPVAKPATKPVTKPKPTTGTKKPATPAAPATPAQAPTSVTLSSQINAGPVKLSAQGKLNQDSSNVTNLTGSAELKVIEGHTVRADIKQGDKKIGFSKVATSHQVVPGVKLTTSTQLDEQTGKVKKYGGGLSYSAEKDSGLQGLSFSAEALAKNDDSFTRPLQGWEKPELKFEFRFTRPLS